MITNDVDEAIYLADKSADDYRTRRGAGGIAENPLPKVRNRTEFHKHLLYYVVRNHIIDFLVPRSRTFTKETPDSTQTEC